MPSRDILLHFSSMYALHIQYASFRLSNTLLSFDCQIHGCAVTFTLCLMVLEQLLDLSLMGSGFMCFCFAEHWASDFAFKADHFAREYGDVNPGIPSGLKAGIQRTSRPHCASHLNNDY